MMQISEIRDAVSQGLLDFAWRQWAQVGVSATAGGGDGWAVDPEALILFTIEIARRDPRLFDEMLDWMAFNHDLLSTQRLRNLAGRFPLPPGLVAAVMSWTRQAGPVPAYGVQAEPARGGEPVFSRDVAAFVSQPDPAFARHGFIRPRAARTGKAHEPDLTLPANLSFRLRRLFGPGGRSEAMRVLLTCSGGPLDTARIADEAGYAKRNINDVLNSLAASGVIRSSWSGNERHFTADQHRWASLLMLDKRGEMPSFIPWAHLLPAVAEIAVWLEEKADTTESDYLIASQARSLVNRIARELESAGIDTQPPRPAHGADYLSVFADICSALLTALGVAAASPRQPASQPDEPGSAISEGEA